MHTEIRRGVGIIGLAVALVLASLAMGASADAAIAGNAGSTAIAALVCAMVGAVMIARGLIDHD